MLQFRIKMARSRTFYAMVDRCTDGEKPETLDLIKRFIERTKGREELYEHRSIDVLLSVALGTNKAFSVRDDVFRDQRLDYFNIFERMVLDELPVGGLTYEMKNLMIAETKRRNKMGFMCFPFL